MRMRLMAAALVAFGGGALAADGTKFSATADCGKPDSMQALPVNDTPGHALVVSKSKCAFTAGELNGLALKEQDVTSLADVHGGKSEDRGYVVVTVDSSDQAFVSFRGRGTMHDPARDGEGTWRFTGGTSKLKGLRGQGTYKATGNTDGTTHDQIEREMGVAPHKPSR
jgi:hypothetical protein